MLTKRYYASFSDICSLRMTCAADKCNASVNLPLTTPLQFPTECPKCNAPWFDLDGDETSLHKLFELLAMRYADKRKFPRYKLHLEFEQPDK